MPSLDIATSRPSFRDCLGLRVHSTSYGSTSDLCVFAKEKILPSSWNGLVRIPRKASSCMGHLEMQSPFTVTAIATTNLPLEANSSSTILNSSSEESSDLEELEKLRRSKISKANKGKVPWNKGRKHSAETIKRIREQTRLAMQDPKVRFRMKLVHLGRSPSDEARIKISLGAKRRWERHRGKLMLQEKCCLEWKNLIAEASRKGYTGDEELQWDSFEILDEQLEKEWLEINGTKESITILADGRKGPKPPGQRRKIAAALSAKWADPEYHVRAGLARYYGSTIGPGRKPRRKSSGTRSSKKQRATEQDACAGAGRSLGGVASGRKSNTPSYKDPLVKSK